MKHVKLIRYCSPFAENKDAAREIREGYLRPELENPEGHVILDFFDIDSSTQSFIHALISEMFQNYGEDALEKIEFKNCNDAIRSLIATVINYSLE